MLGEIQHQSDVAALPGKRSPASTAENWSIELAGGCDGGDDVAAAIAIARQFNAPILCRGGGTSLAGQCCNVALVLDFSK
ncbi:MAG TPA: FAD-binding protein, partial [Terriglobales bacterium]|nr:FAD-binding protein [Terriglobales bacterium]